MLASLSPLEIVLFIIGAVGITIYAIITIVNVVKKKKKAKNKNIDEDDQLIMQENEKNKQ